jgi:integrase
MAEKNATTHILMDRELVLYQRERSSVWQCRFKVGNKWQRASTKETDIRQAKAAAKRLMIEAEIRLKSDLPVITRRFRDVAKLAVQRLQHELDAGGGKVIYNEYIRVINDYLIPCFARRLITNIDYYAIQELELWRQEKLGRVPSHTTLLTHNAALNRVFDEGIIRGYLTDANRPTLTAKGKKYEKRAAFEMKEIHALFANFDAWIERGVNEASKERRRLLCDYVHVLFDTGARPGKELLDLKWQKIKYAIKPVIKKTGVDANIDGEREEIETNYLNKSVEFTVKGKTGTRNIIGNYRTVEALARIARRNYSVETPLLNPLVNVARPNNSDYVFRVKVKLDNKNKEELIDVSNSFQKMFESYLEEHNLLVDPVTEQNRVFYSLRHTYATLQLEIQKINPHVLATQMGTSILMIERHYSHLKVSQAIEQLRGEELNRVVEAGSVIDELYQSKRKKK